MTEVARGQAMRFFLDPHQSDVQSSKVSSPALMRWKSSKQTLVSNAQKPTAVLSRIFCVVKRVSKRWPPWASAPAQAARRHS